MGSYENAIRQSERKQLLADTKRDRILSASNLICLGLNKEQIMSSLVGLTEEEYAMAFGLAQSSGKMGNTGCYLSGNMV